MQAEGYEASITPGRGGQFDVVADGGVVFSKSVLGRFPEDGEVMALLRNRS